MDTTGRRPHRLAVCPAVLRARRRRVTWRRRRRRHRPGTRRPRCRPRCRRQVAATARRRRLS